MKPKGLTSVPKTEASEAVVRQWLKQQLDANIVTQIDRLECFQNHLTNIEEFARELKYYTRDYPANKKKLNQYIVQLKKYIEDQQKNLELEMQYDNCITVGMIK